MCWVSYKKPYKKTAKNDIVVYKILSQQDDKILSPIMRTEWKLGELKSINNQIKINHSIKRSIHYIFEGIHTFSKKPYIFIYTTYFNGTGVWKNEFCMTIWPKKRDEHLYECIIPKGSIYYVNDRGEVVSNRLIVKHKVEFKIQSMDQITCQNDI